MENPTNPSRRRAMMAAASIPFASAMSLSANSANAQQPGSESRELVVFLSRTGNTRVIAHQIRRARQTDIFEIETAEDYPEDYEEMVAKPPLKAQVSGIASYETVYLGFPIWGTTAPSPVRSFLSTHDLSGKTLIPFITHGGFGLGNSLSVIVQHAPRARILEGFSLQADQEKQTLAEVTGWLNSTPK
jgi:flavodoxin